MFKIKSKVIYTKSKICFDSRVSDVSLGVLSLPGRVRSLP